MLCIKKDSKLLFLRLGDPLEWAQWRSKQNLDYAFLMMYAQWRGTFYVQLEDDILTKPYFVATMRDKTGVGQNIIFKLDVECTPPLGIHHQKSIV